MAIMMTFQDAAALGHRWEAMLRDLEAAFSIGITIHDLRGIMSDRDGNRLLPGRHLHPHPVCQRQDPTAFGFSRCSVDCVTVVNSKAAALRRPFRNTCWKGMTEVVVPILQQEQVMALFFAGPFRARKHRGPDRAHVPAAIHQAWQQLPFLCRKRAESIERLLTTLGHGMLGEVETLHQIDRTDPDRAEQIRRFMYDHAHQPVGIGDLAAHLHLSTSRTGHVVLECLGLSFKELLLQERMRRARVLLQSSHFSAKVVGERVGIANPYYFSRLFKAHTGLTPLGYRAKTRRSVQR